MREDEVQSEHARNDRMWMMKKQTEVFQEEI